MVCGSPAVILRSPPSSSTHRNFYLLLALPSLASSLSFLNNLLSLSLKQGLMSSSSFSYVFEAGLGLLTLQSPPPKCVAYKCVPLHWAQAALFRWRLC